MIIKYLRELPLGYEYKIIFREGDIKIVGINPDKEPIMFVKYEDSFKKIMPDDTGSTAFAKGR